MLKITGNSALDCDGISRRSFVQAGVLGVGGMTLADFLKVKSLAARNTGTKDTAVILF